MKITLGLNCYHADSSAAIFIDNKLCFAIEEERINRLKHWSGLPVESIKECLIYSKKNLHDITDITLNTNPKSNFTKKSIFFLKNFIFGQKKFEIITRLKKKVNLKKDLEYKLNGKFNASVKIHYIDHHLSHLSSAFYPSGYEKAVGLSIDGFGDFCSIAIAKCNNKNIEIIKRTFFPHSLGLIYEAFTQLIGFKKYGEEYKMMGLSCYGQPVYYELIKKKIFKNYKNHELNLQYFNHTNTNFKYNFNGEPHQNIIFSDKIKHLSKDFININDEVKKNIASSIQKIFEEKLIDILKECYDYNYSENLIYSGGCALNSLANKKIYETSIFKKIFIPYAPADNGGSIGSALFYLKDYFQNFENLKSPYLGNSNSNEDINAFLNKKNIFKKFDVKKFDNYHELNKSLAQKISENNVVGYFIGRMEFGARALGNRSILANPSNPNMKEILNLKIKKRENFRPFAPAILLEHKKEWFGNDLENPYMSNVEIILNNKRKKIPAVTHFDGTGRVQTVSKDNNKEFYDLINEFYKITDIPILLNTSFNENEPIVRFYNEALECFLRTKMDILVLNNFIIKR